MARGYHDKPDSLLDTAYFHGVIGGFCWYVRGDENSSAIVLLAHNFKQDLIIPYPTAFPYGNGMVLHFYQQQESSTTKTVHKVINKRLKTYV